MHDTNTILTCKAAIAWAPNTPLVIEEVQVLPPKCTEVRIKIISTGVCSTDAYTLNGHDPEGVFPVILGHEGAGIVESVGSDVKDISIGDHVIPLYIPQCKTCKFCKSHKTNLCSKIRDTQGRGVMPDSTTRFICKGKEIFHFMGCSTFSEYTIVSAISIAKISHLAPLSDIGLLGCGISTGYGAALNTANVEANSTCGIWGLGAVGLATIMGCVEAGACKIIGIDTNPSKFSKAIEFGATECINPNDYPDKPLQQVISELTDGGFDYTFECIGNVQTMRDALESCHKGWGISTIIGVAPAGSEISTRPFQLITGRTWKGCAFGGWKSRDSVPELVNRCISGRMKLSEFITHRMPLEDINQAFSLLKDGKSIRTMIDM